MKKTYIIPTIEKKNFEMCPLLHVMSDLDVNQAAPDTTNDDTNVKGFGFDNNIGGADVSFGRDRASVDWDF